VDHASQGILEICFGIGVLLAIFYLAGMDEDIKH
jgi:hypothetical protein